MRIQIKKPKRVELRKTIFISNVTPEEELIKTLHLSMIAVIIKDSTNIYIIFGHLYSLLIQ